jgi:hypothetical protein
VIPDVIVDGKELFKVMIGESNRVDNSVLRVIENLRGIFFYLSIYKSTNNVLIFNFSK